MICADHLNKLRRKKESGLASHGSALVGSDPHELAPRFEASQMKDTHIGTSELNCLNPMKLAFCEFDHCAFGP